DSLDASAIDVADRPATAFLGAELTFREIKRRSDRLAHALAALGLSKADRVGIMLPNCPQYIIAAFAILRLGAVVVNINPTYTAREVLNVATDSGIRLLITLDVLAPLALSVKEQTAIERIVITSLAEYAEPPGSAPRVTGTDSLAEMLGSNKPGVFRVDIASTDLAVLQYTGGTTGTPKGAM